MNNEQQTYVLKRPINAWPNFDSNEMVVELENDDYRCSLEAFNEDFVPLDVSGLTRQVEKQIHKAFIRGYEYGLKTDGEPSEDPTFDYEKLKTTIAEQVVLLFLNQERETK